MDRGRWLRFPLLGAGLVIALVLSRRWPTDHELHIVLGDAAPVVHELRVRYAEAPAGTTSDDWQREVAFHFEPGHAPRVVDHVSRVVSGDYDVEVEIEVAPGSHLPLPHPVSGRGGATPEGASRVTTTRRVRLDSGAASIDVSAAVRDSLEAAAAPP